MKRIVVIFSGIALILVIWYFSTRASRPTFRENPAVAHLIGTRPGKLELLDSNKLDPGNISTTDSLMILDFWFTNCPGCLQEMKQFDRLLSKGKNKVSIASISINSFENWKHLFSSPQEIYSFLKIKNPKWRQFVLRSTEDPSLRNDIPLDNYEQITSRFKTHAFPIYLVLNEDGRIVATPSSAVEYLEYLQAL